jgi:hypothetical protein
MRGQGGMLLTSFANLVFGRLPLEQRLRVASRTEADSRSMWANWTSISPVFSKIGESWCGFTYNSTHKRKNCFGLTRDEPRLMRRASSASSPLASRRNDMA